MGLAGPRVRRKIQHDPNNTKWSRDETTFGQRILRAQGWEPGKFLGVQDAAHSNLHSAASAAPINVIIKDDTMGLGAKPKHKQNTECTGLDGFKDLLGRLNGKSEEVIEKEREVRSGIKTNLYVERKYGLMRFVSGGLLVGDQMKELVSTTTAASVPTDASDEKSTSISDDATTRPAKKQKKDKKSKKRKVEDTDSTEVPEPEPEKKRKKRSKDEISQDDSIEEPRVKESEKKKSKKSKRANDEDTEPEKKKKSKKSKKDPKSEVKDDSSTILPEETHVEKSKSKKEKKEKKEKSKKDKKDRKERKQKDSESPASSTETPTSTDTPVPISALTPQESGTSTPTGTGTSTPQAVSARHLARSRHIASKRLAMADMAALNQIFMVKPV
ncbi:hypothetical protein M426DRAFT_322773 [Hypoxylon sp. CI-4A]|nr:hypothetical protein M426DRAFT_322773 [Hypoxylon sp. CI-4A]